MSNSNVRPNDLITVTQAAIIAERSERTIRRWASLKVGKLGHWEGQPNKGGAAPVLISKEELMSLLAISKQQPRINSIEKQLDTAPIQALDMTETRTVPLELVPISDVRMAELQGQLACSVVREKLARAEAQRDGLTESLRAAQALVDELRMDRDDWRNRFEQEKAENQKLREKLGFPLWKRLLGVQSDPVPKIASSNKFLA